MHSKGRAAIRKFQDARLDELYAKERAYDELKAHADAMAEAIESEPRLAHPYLCLLSRLFNEWADLQDPTHRTINEWLKAMLGRLAMQDPQRDALAAYRKWTEGK